MLLETPVADADAEALAPSTETLPVLALAPVADADAVALAPVTLTLPLLASAP